jgi:hypothetical protein
MARDGGSRRSPVQPALLAIQRVLLRRQGMEKMIPTPPPPGAPVITNHPPDLSPITANDTEMPAGAFRSDWCVYEIWMHDPNVPPDYYRMIYIGHDKVREVWSLVRPMRNTEFQRLVADDTFISIRIRYRGDEHNCRNEAYRRVRNESPHCNTKGFDTTGMQRAIICNQMPGIEYRTQAECAAALNINQGLLSTHLSRNHPKAVKGMTFRYKEVTPR